MKSLSQEIFLLVLAAGALCGSVLAILALLISVDGIRTRSAGDMRCPGCGIRDIRPSAPRGVMDLIYRRLKCVPYRCRHCGLRFHRYEEARRAAV